MCRLSYIVSLFATVSTAVTYDKGMKAIKVKVPDSDEEFYLHPSTVIQNDRSAQSVVSGIIFCSSVIELINKSDS